MEAKGAAGAEEAVEAEDGVGAAADGAASNLGATAVGAATNMAVADGTVVVDGRATTAEAKDMGAMAQVPAMMALQLDSWVS